MGYIREIPVLPTTYVSGTVFTQLLTTPVVDTCRQTHDISIQQDQSSGHRTRITPRTMEVDTQGGLGKHDGIR